MRLEFNEVVIIQSLPADGLQTGSRLYDHLNSLDLPRVQVSLVTPTTAEELFAVLDAIALRAQNGGWTPIVHFELHGTKIRHALVTASGEALTWRDLAEPLRHINVAVRNSLIVVLGACSGAFIATAAATSPFEPAPFCGLIGPDAPVTDFFLLHGFCAFYSELMKTQDFAKALYQLRQRSLPEYIAVDTAQLFRTGWQNYERTQLQGRVFEERVKRILKRHNRQQLAQFVSRNKARAEIARRLREVSSRREQYYRHFIMADRFPENAEKFPRLTGA